MGLTWSIAGGAAGVAILGGAAGGYQIAEVASEIDVVMGESSSMETAASHCNYCNPTGILAGGVMGSVLGGIAGATEWGIVQQIRKNQKYY